MTAWATIGPLALLRGRVRPRDVRLAASVAAIEIAATVGAGHGHHWCWWAATCTARHRVSAGGLVLLALAPAALALRGRWPRQTLAAVFAVNVGYVALGEPQGPNYLSLAIALVGTIVAGHRVTAAVFLVGSWATVLGLGTAVADHASPSVPGALALAAWSLVGFAGAEGVRARRQRVIETRRARQREERRHVYEERLRIARELHDVLAHNISLINVQSGVALHLFDERPEQARVALSAINDASADALREVRSVLGILRGDGEPPPHAPAGLASLDELVARAAGAGVQVSVRVEGDSRPVPAAVDLAAYRIIQEAVTNVVRHAGTRAASVSLGYGTTDLSVQIDDDGPGVRLAATGNGGSGIVGMRERVAALGGEFEAGPRPAGGFRVRARLPLRRSS
jgi:signal transduction histidine kinase